MLPGPVQGLDGVRVLASAIEHPSLLRHLERARDMGRIRLELFPVTTLGQPDLNALARMVASTSVGLVCSMLVLDPFYSVMMRMFINSITH